MKNRRLDDRTPFDARVTLTLLEGDGEATTLECAVVDYSAEGIGLRTDRPIRLHTSIQVVVGKDTFVGTVRHCLKSPFGFYSVGVKLNSTAVSH